MANQRTIEEKPMNIDLQQERRLATLKSEEFAEWWAGGKKALASRRERDQYFFEDPEFQDSEPISFMSHKKLYENTTAKAAKFVKKLRAWHEREEKTRRLTTTTTTTTKSKENLMRMLETFQTISSGSLANALFRQSFPLGLHFSMFLPTILGQSSPEQLENWFEKAWRMDGWIGTYAQTELGHGTFLRGLETRADYDIEREEFILNTPTLTSYKWWPGGLGQTANIAIIMAQLYIKGQHYGLQPFLVRIRNEETHEPEPGVDVGEIGAKFGANGANNGFLGLKNVRIPRMQMLMKNSKVLADGTFVKLAESLLIYGTMVYVRVTIVRMMSFHLLQAATIATRYSLVRRQSPIEPGQPEPKIIEHLTQQAKVFPQIAKGVFYRLAADYMWTMYQRVMQELDAGNRLNLPELHALSCCMKAICSHDASSGIDILRRACGGHGYMSMANFGSIYTLATAACTYEGENTVLLLQSARFLVRNYSDSLKGKVLPKSVKYLLNSERVKFGNGLMMKSLVRLFEVTAAEKIRLAFEEQREKNRKYSSAMANNLCGLKMVQAAAAHGRAFLARISNEEIVRLKKHVKPEVYGILVQLLEIFIIDMFLENLGEILRCCNAINAKKIGEIEARFEELLAAFRPNAIAVVDGFDFHDRTLGSVLGCYDGRVYERMMEEAKKSPLNQEKVNRTFHTHLKPLMKGHL